MAWRKALSARCFAALVAGFLHCSVGAAFADTLETALAPAYQNNPQINAQRAAVRAIDESVPQALAGYRPQINATASITGQQTRTTTQGIDSTGTAVTS